MKIIPYLLFSLMSCSLLAQAPTKEDLLSALEENPENRSALYNLGLLNYLSGTPEDSIDPWTKLETLEPHDWQLKAKIIQAYSASGEKEQRDKRIKELKTQRASGRYPELSEATFFIRDQFKVGGFYVYVFDYYEMDAGWEMGPIAWKFRLKEKGENIDRFFSLGSYDAATEYAQATGEIGKEDKIFHLDEYWLNGSHATHGMYKNRPGYDLIKEEVIQILEEQSKPISSFQPSANQAGDDNSE